jgi:hypothetical protein|tara:strand:+ start:1381 stop:2127 length:747 start_codon:yes stop_codon:yes gene_type:complete
MGIGTAIIGGSIISGVLGSNAAKKSAKANERGQERGIAEQGRQFDITQGNLQPFQEAGQKAIGSQQDLLGLNGVEAQQASFAAMQDSPGQQFLRARAQKNLLRNSSAIGGLGGGNVRSALVEQGVGFAQQDLQNQFGRLGQLAGQGQNAATSIGQFGQQSANNISNAQSNIGSARSSGIINQSNAIQGAFSGALQGAAQGGFFGSSTPPSQFGGGNAYSAQNLNLSQIPLGINTGAGSFNPNNPFTGP